MAVPEPYDALFDVAKGRCRVTIVAGTVAQRLEPTLSATLGFRIARGRMLFEAQAMNGNIGNKAAPVALAIAVGKELWHVELTSPGTVCGIEVQPAQPEGLEQLPDPGAFVGTLFVRNGSASFTDAGGQRQVITGPASMPLSPEEPRVPVAHTAEMVALYPSWLTPDARPLSANARRSATQFDREIQKDQPVSQSVPAIAGDPQPRIAELACKLLDLTGDYKPLVKALARSDHAEVRQTAIVGLRNWLGTAAENDALMHEELQRNFQPDDAELVYRLLWGFGTQDARDPVVSQQLVGWLMHENIAVRELAIYHLVRLTGGRYRYDYHAHLPQGPRKSAADRWQSHLERNGGALLK
jgi:hypothetical protein